MLSAKRKTQSAKLKNQGALLTQGKQQSLIFGEKLI